MRLLKKALTKKLAFELRIKSIFNQTFCTKKNQNNVTRTHDRPLPKRARYPTALYPVKNKKLLIFRFHQFTDKENDLYQKLEGKII